MNDEPNATVTAPFRDVIRIDEVVRDSVEQTLNALLDAEADCPATPIATSATPLASTAFAAATISS